MIVALNVPEYRGTEGWKIASKLTRSVLQKKEPIQGLSFSYRSVSLLVKPSLLIIFICFKKVDLPESPVPKMAIGKNTHVDTRQPDKSYAILSRCHSRVYCVTSNNSILTDSRRSCSFPDRDRDKNLILIGNPLI